MLDRLPPDLDANHQNDKWNYYYVVLNLAYVQNLK